MEGFESWVGIVQWSMFISCKRYSPNLYTLAEDSKHRTIDPFFLLPPPSWLPCRKIRQPPSLLSPPFSFLSATLFMESKLKGNSNAPPSWRWYWRRYIRRRKKKVNNHSFFFLLALKKIGHILTRTAILMLDLAGMKTRWPRHRLKVGFKSRTYPRCWNLKGNGMGRPPSCQDLNPWVEPTRVSWFDHQEIKLSKTQDHIIFETMISW